MNKYKIDVSNYYDVDRPFALYERSSRWGKWQYITSSMSKEKLREQAGRLKGLPEYIED